MVPFERYEHLPTRGILAHATLLVDENESKERQEALTKVLVDNGVDAKILKSTETGDSINLATAFVNAAISVDGLYDELIPEGGSKKVNLRVEYSQDNSHFVVNSELGKIRIGEILFQGEITIAVEKIPLLSIKKYENLMSGEEIATTASFDFEIDGIRRELSFHRIAETGEVHISVSAPK